MRSGASDAVRRQLRAVIFAVLALSLTGGLAMAQFFPEAEPTNDEIMFGCTPGPVEELHHADPPLPQTRVASPSDAVQTASLRVDYAPAQ